MEDILKWLVAAGIVSWLLNLMKDLWHDWQGRRFRGRQQAFELSNKLKILSITCEEIVSHHQLEETPPGQHAPDPPAFPKQDFLEMTRGLSDLDSSDLARIADLEMQKLVEESYISFGWQTWMDIDDVSELQLKRLRFLAKEAGELADIVRKKHGLPGFADHARLLRDE